MCLSPLKGTDLWGRLGRRIAKHLGGKLNLHLKWSWDENVALRISLLSLLTGLVLAGSVLLTQGPREILGKSLPLEMLK